MSQETFGVRPHGALESPNDVPSRAKENLCLSSADPGTAGSESTARSTAEAETRPLQNRTELDVYSTLSWSTREVTQATLDRCTSGEGFACLGLGEYFFERGADAKGRAKGLAYYQRAFSILVLKCNHREPDACIGIAHLHRLGRGLPISPTAETALIDRARELCRSKPGLVCRALTQD